MTDYDLSVHAWSLTGWIPYGWELGLMPIASLSVTRDLLGAGYTDAIGGAWFARLTAGLMFGGTPR